MDVQIFNCISFKGYPSRYINEEKLKDSLGNGTEGFPAQHGSDRTTIKRFFLEDPEILGGPAYIRPWLQYMKSF